MISEQSIFATETSGILGVAVSEKDKPKGQRKQRRPSYQPPQDVDYSDKNIQTGVPNVVYQSYDGINLYCDVSFI